MLSVLPPPIFPTSLLIVSCPAGGEQLHSLLRSHRTDQSSRLLNYHPSATVVRLLTTNALIAYITSWVLFLSGASEDPRLLLPAWISIATVSASSLLCFHGKSAP